MTLQTLKHYTIYATLLVGQAVAALVVVSQFHQYHTGEAELGFAIVHAVWAVALLFALQWNKRSQREIQKWERDTR